MQQVEQGGVIGGRGRRHEVARGGDGGEAVVAGQEERVDGGGDGGDVGGVEEGRGNGGGGEDVVCAGVLQEGEVFEEGRVWRWGACEEGAGGGRVRGARGGAERSCIGRGLR